MPRKLAPTIGISVDPRRQNLSEESLTANVARLKEYMSRLILFPRRNGKQKAGDASADEVKAAKGPDGNVLKKTTMAQPIINERKVTEATLADEEGEVAAYRKLRDSRSEAKLVGVKAKRAKAKEEEANAAKK